MRDLDAEVAEKVMGWEYIPGFAATMAVATWHQGDNVYRQVAEWNPKTDIRDAWMVAEKTRERGFRLEITEYSDGWYARFLRPGERGFMDWHAAQMETAPEAICRAALEALSDGDTKSQIRKTHSQFPRRGPRET